MPYTAVQQLFDPFLPAHDYCYYFKFRDLADLDNATISTIIRLAKKRPVNSILFAIWAYGGAMARVEPTATAFPGRKTSFLFSCDAIWEDRGASDSVVAWRRGVLAEMERHAGESMYVDFPGSGEEGDELARRAYSVNYDRLASIKAKYDPHNLFRSNLNVLRAAKPTRVTVD
jgi:hypothetical protein